MRRLSLCLLLMASLCRASDDGAAILGRARQAVAAQLERAANYACVQTIDRQYLIDPQQQPLGCTPGSVLASQTLWMRDRLRLDVAVSEGHEIYSWHGEETFTSADVSDVVQTGPISSGNFIGFLHNIFLERGARFTYAAENEEHGSKTYSFDYVMPLSHSAYQVGTKTHGKVLVPYHGSFSLEGSDYQLTRLQVIADDIPSEAPICSAETTITYQTVSIGGQPSLIPASFVLDLEDERHVHTISSSRYSQCREFRGESIVHFESADAAAPPFAGPSKAEVSLPAGLTLRIALRTPIDDRTGYVGDPVQGVLVDKVKVPGTGTVVPKGAVLEGIITNLEDHYLPESFQLLSVKFIRLTFGNTSFLLNAWPETSFASWRFLRHVYGSPLPAFIAKEDRRGLFVLHSSHLHLDRHFAGKWITAIPSSAGADSSPQ